MISERLRLRIKTISESANFKSYRLLGLVAVVGLGFSLVGAAVFLIFASNASVANFSLIPNPAEVTDVVDLQATIEGASPGQRIVTAAPNVSVSGTGTGEFAGVLGADGFPVFVYRRVDYPNYGVWVTKCGNEKCSAGNVTNQVTTLVGRVGIAVGADGFPVIMHDTFSGGVSRLNLVKCGNASCSSGNTSAIVQDSSGGYNAWGNYSGELGGDGLVAFSFHSAASSYLDNRINLLHCDNVACSTFTVTTVDQNDGLKNDAFGGDSNLAMGADGLPIMAYYTGSANGYPANGVKVAKCGDATCSSGNTKTVVSGTNSNANYTIQIAVPSDGLPVVNFDYFANMGVLKCGNGACSAGNITSTFAVTANISRAGAMAVGPDNLPVLTWPEYVPLTYNDKKWNLLKCGNTTCSAGNTTVVLEQGHSGNGGQVFVRNDNTPIATMAGGNDQSDPYSAIPRIRVADCQDAVCSPWPGTTVAAAEYYIGATDPGEGNGTPMTPLDGAFDSQSEVAVAEIDTLPLSGGDPGSFEIHVRGQDSEGWGNVSTQTLVVNKLTQQPVDSGTGTSPITITFEHIVQGGTSSVTISNTGPNPPSGYKFLSPRQWYQLSTTVQYEGNVTICLDYTSLDPTDETKLHFQKWEQDTHWTEYTSSIDTNNNIICAVVPELSLWAVFEEVPVPVVGEITAPLDPVAVGTTVNASAGGTYAGPYSDLAAEWNWGDGSTSVGNINIASNDFGVTGSHVYNEAGVNRVTLTLTTPDTSGSNTFEFVVVYNPAGGFVTGGGWINSPAGAYAAAPLMTGKANFGFVSKYKNGASTPEGTTEFNFKVANLNFHSDIYDWLVVAGANAKYKGTGTINGRGSYKFMLTATDANPDTFRIKIWDDNGVVYDNKMSESDDSYAGTAIGGGNIQVHKSK
ncbi:hypothetical protein A2V54_02490 [candidate division WWE3 bacterium RBG_19FT_COMBO_53_11]|uniref:PKD domain-containing protein n=1 Tax=candidate division WWE3 bacterium RBG_19FT_COMBO_53_11 TaxID=1802613 RepID=A0A1F4UH88_UNCKA|nr:MAG: hypothetical protein A2155_00520 [candidate division WWE3 bacterium RBG_16_52_45]OGC44279.1 MAG: hypothetical protein A2V54_02490 [candidate division WWE3 bacterium RBG_19FT_COMBO_53_11]